MGTVLWIIGLITGYIVGLLIFSNIVLPALVGLPLSVFGATRGRIQWGAALFYIRAIALWSIITIGGGWAALEFVPLTGLGAELRVGIYRGIGIGFIFTAAYAVFWPEGRRSIREDIQVRLLRYATAEAAMDVLKEIEKQAENKNLDESLE